MAVILVRTIDKSLIVRVFSSEQASKAKSRIIFRQRIKRRGRKEVSNVEKSSKAVVLEYRAFFVLFEASISVDGFTWTGAERWFTAKMDAFLRWTRQAESGFREIDEI